VTVARTATLQRTTQPIKPAPEVAPPQVRLDLQQYVMEQIQKAQEDNLQPTTQLRKNAQLTSQ
jgi:hypothetical protein